MRIVKNKNGKRIKNDRKSESGFSLVEVIIAGTLMIILCIGILTVFSYTVKINRGENLRAQALTILQKEVEYYRSLKFVPVGTSAELYAGTYTNVRTQQSADGREFYVSVTIINLPSGATEAECKFKEIRIDVKPKVAETGWLADLKTELTVQRVRSN